MDVSGLRWGWPTRGAAIALALLGVGVFTRSAVAQTVTSTAEGSEPQALAARVAAGTWNRFTARVSVRRHLVTTAGEPADGRAALGRVGSTTVGPDVSGGGTSEYVIERQQTRRGWKTRVTVLAGSRPTVRTRSGDVSLAEPPSIARVEDDEDGSAPRFFDNTGTEVLMPTSGVWRRFVGEDGRRPSLPGETQSSIEGPGGLLGLDAALVDQAKAVGAPRRAVGREWVRSFVMTPGSAAERRQTIQRSLGRRAGWVRGYGRYLRDAGDRRIEVLLDEQHGVPVETNVVERGLLRSHTVYQYDRSTAGVLVRRGVRVERALSQPAGAADAAPARVVTDITFSQVRLDSAETADTRDSIGGL